MLPTHVLGGMLLAAPLVRVAPELAPIGFVAGFLGGLFPDLDMYVGHRKTLHFPVYYSAFAALALFAALAVPSAATVGAALFLLGAAVHSVADMYGGGLELRPWGGTPTAPCTTTTAGPGSPATARAVRRRSRGPRAVDRAVASPPLPAQRPVSAGRARHARRRRRVHDDPAPSRGACGLDHPYAPDALLPFLPDRYHDDDRSSSDDNNQTQ